MTLQFIGTLKYRFRLSLFGHDIFAGPWQSQTVSVSEPVASKTATVNLPDGFSATCGESGSGANLSIYWEGIPLMSEILPVSGSLPISLQPLKGVILAGTASVS